jgi:hypothetical protein
MAMLTLFVTALLCLLLGLAAGAVIALLLLRHGDDEVAPEPELLDEWTAAAIDQAAVGWVKANNLPDEAAGLVAAKLRLLHKLGSERGWH